MLLNHTSWLEFALPSQLLWHCLMKPKLILFLVTFHKIWNLKVQPNHLREWAVLFLTSLTKDSPSNSHQPGGGNKPDSPNDDREGWNNASLGQCLFLFLEAPPIPTLASVSVTLPGSSFTSKCPYLGFTSRGITLVFTGRSFLPIGKGKTMYLVIVKLHSTPLVSHFIIMHPKL